MWASVRKGEEEYIFPFQESADAMFNSVLIYELAVLKQYAEPLLFGICKGEPEYYEAKRLLVMVININTGKGANINFIFAFIGKGIRHGIVQPMNPFQHQHILRA